MNVRTHTESGASSLLACQTCGSSLHVGASFCGVCGAQTDVGAADRVPVVTSARRALRSTVPVPVSADAPVHPMAVVSLVLGLLAFGPMPVVGSVGALLTARVARRSFAEAPGKHRGRGLAQAGMILGIVQLGLLGLAVVAGLAIVAFFAFIR